MNWAFMSGLAIGPLLAHAEFVGHTLGHATRDATRAVLTVIAVFANPVDDDP